MSAKKNIHLHNETLVAQYRDAVEELFAARDQETTSQKSADRLRVAGQKLANLESRLLRKLRVYENKARELRQVQEQGVP